MTKAWRKGFFSVAYMSIRGSKQEELEILIEKKTFYTTETSEILRNDHIIGILKSFVKTCLGGTEEIKEEDAVKELLAPQNQKLLNTRGMALFSEIWDWKA